MADTLKCNPVTSWYTKMTFPLEFKLQKCLQLFSYNARLKLLHGLGVKCYRLEVYPLA